MKILAKSFRSNIGIFERVVSGVAGTVILFKSRNLQNNTLRKAAGIYLIARAAVGYCILYDALQKDEVNTKIHNVNIKLCIFIDRPRNEVYSFWRRLENLPLFMKHLHKVTELDEIVSEWKVDLPGIPGHITWKSEILLDEVNDRIGWHSLPGAPIRNAGNVHFRDAGSGTEVHAILSYAPSGKITEGIGKLFSPIFEKMVRDDIASFKDYMESTTMLTK
jgi:uncharacterized membrane protein